MIEVFLWMSIFGVLNMLYLPFKANFSLSFFFFVKKTFTFNFQVPVVTATISIDRSCQYPEGTFPYFKGLADSVMYVSIIYCIW